MRSLIAAVALGCTLSSTALASESEPQPAERAGAPPIVLGIDVIPGLATSRDHPDRQRLYSVNLIGGRSGGSQRLEVGWLFNLASGDVRGVQLVGGANVNAESIQGVQIAGGANINGADSRGSRSPWRISPTGTSGGSNSASSTSPARPPGAWAWSTSFSTATSSPR